jgi:CubicO group peptidase (beta-lactamase class C family)
MCELNNYLNRKIEENRITSYNIVVVKKGETLFSTFGGFSVLNPQKLKTKQKTIYDLASITKPLATAFLIAVFLENKKLKLDDTLGFFFADIPKDKNEITIEQLLTHTSGIISWKPLYYKEQNFNSVFREALETKLEKLPGQSVIYSCLNYILLKAIIEKISGENYISLFNKLVKTPLKTEDTYFSPPEKIKERISATENGNRYEQEKALNIFKLKIPERKGVIWGKVHDGNSFFSGGTAGNAGLFSTAEDVSKIAMEFLPNSNTILKNKTIPLFYKNMTPFSSVHRSIGFILKTSQGASISKLLSDKTIYHFGFTGTSITIEPDRELIITILLNRVHPKVHEPTHSDIIKRVQDIIMRKYV